MKKRSLVVLFCLTAMITAAQKVNWKKISSFKPDNILLSGQRQPTKVLLLGTFHFGYPNLDGHKTDSSKYINVKSAQRQQEIEELATVIKRFQPTRIYVESNDGEWIDSLYNEWLADRYQLGRNEIYQIGFRIGKQMGHSKIYSADTWPFSMQYRNKYSWIDSLWDFNTPVDSVRDTYWGKKYKEWYTASDSIEVQLTMLENFLLMAEPATIQRMHGAYLANGFNTDVLTHDGGQQGPDALSVWWYNRNLRIFNNILRTRPAATDRIIVLFGNGHMPLLKHCFYSSPEFEVVELKSLLK